MNYEQELIAKYKALHEADAEASGRMQGMLRAYREMLPKLIQALQPGHAVFGREDRKG